MDRGILSEAKLLEASHDFICVRPATYADAEEGAFLKKVGHTRTGGVLNTTFVLLAPDGKTPLSGAGRSPRQAFPGSEEETLQQLVEAMGKIAKKYPGNTASASGHPIPYALDFRNALNIAACDNQPLIVVKISSDKVRKAAEARLASLVWKPEYRGRFTFAMVDENSDLKEIARAPNGNAIFIIEPGPYGMDGKTIARAKSPRTCDLESLLNDGLKKFNRTAGSNRDLRTGLREGVTWESESIEVREADPALARRSQRRERQGRFSR